MKPSASHRLAVLALAATGLLLGPAAVSATTPSDLADLVGARGAGGEMELGRRGYSYVTMTHGVQYWWNADRKACVGIKVADGHYKSVSAATPSECQQMAGHGSASHQATSPADERVHFDKGSSGAELTGTLPPGESRRYRLHAKSGQNLYVRVAARGSDIYYQIFNPDRSFLLDQMTSDREYRGQLWQSGDHVVEVINRGRSDTSYNVIFGIE